MEKVRFTRRVREKLRDLGWEKDFSCKKVDVVRTGRGNYTKHFGSVWVTLMIDDHLVQRVQSVVHFQSSDLDFAKSLMQDFLNGIQEVENLGFFTK